MAGNPDPVRTPEFLAQQKPKYGDRALAPEPLSIRFPADVREILRGMPDRQSYIRQAVEERLKADGLLPGNPNP